MKNPKIIAMYLPQYHRIPENDKFWGEGFTDWVTVQNAKPLFDGHQQPRAPFNNNYYDLSQKESITWQAKLAKEYGVYGFGIYHYWFNNDQNLLSKPAEIIRDNNDININYFFAWDNISWKRSWSGVKDAYSWAPAYEKKHDKGPAVLVQYILGNEQDWKLHYDYLKTFFKDNRYIKKDNKPVFAILHYNQTIAKMCAYWNDLAIKDGFNGICPVFRYDKKENTPDSEYKYMYEPLFSGWTGHNIYSKIINKIGNYKRLHFGPRILSYDRIWKRILKMAEKNDSPYIFSGAFVSYDDTPRRSKKGIIVKGGNPEQFKMYMSELMKITSKHNKDFIFLTAWNEWGEGAYLEPDVNNNIAYLEVIKEIVTQ